LYVGVDEPIFKCTKFAHLLKVFGGKEVTLPNSTNCNYEQSEKEESPPILVTLGAIKPLIEDPL
jgi:hypothetical protein